MTKKILLLVLIFFLGGLFGYGLFLNFPENIPFIQKQSGPYQAFITEVYDKTLENYWDNVSDTQVLDLFKLALEKNTDKPYLSKLSSKEDLSKTLALALKNLDEEKRKKLVVNVASQVLASLNPQGRSGLFTQKQQEQLKNTVENINPQKDLYKDLELSKGASETQVKEAYQKKAEELKKESSLEAQEKLKQITYARDVLTQKDSKARYDQKSVEPTIFTRLLSPNILYLQFKKFSPTTLDEFQKGLSQYEDVGAEALIFDVRGNVGGAIDATSHLSGYFIGKNQYAFEFFHKGEYLPFKTPTDRIPTISKFRQIVILVDNQTQSSAEMMAATLKKYNVGVVVGVPTRGWGTVERVFPLDNQIDKGEKYSMFLVHSITLRDDNQPIEGRGVEPNVNIKDANWEAQLFSYFRNPQLILAVKLVKNEYTTF